MIDHGLPVYVALEPVDMRLDSERLGAQVRERMHAEPRSLTLFVFVGNRGHTSSFVLTISIERLRLCGRCPDVIALSRVANLAVPVS